MKTILFITFTFWATAGFAQNKIPVDSASRHIGEIVTICSVVYGIKTTDKMTFIDVGAKYPNAPLRLVILTGDLQYFSDTPAKMYGDKSICVTGTLKEYNGKAEIFIKRADEITVEEKQ